MSEADAREFACDAMMKGLARWLRACGYDATWKYGIPDDELLAVARREQRVVLTADRGILIRRAVKAGRPHALYVPNALPPLEQVRRVLAAFALPMRPPRCMGCGGDLRRVEKDSVAGEAPPRTFAAFDDFFRCARCSKLFWQGTHWERIASHRRNVARAAIPEPVPTASDPRRS